MSANPFACSLRDVPIVASSSFEDRCFETYKAGGRIAALTAIPALGEHDDSRDLIALMANDEQRRLEPHRARVPAGGHFPSLSVDMPQAQAFEREIWETQGLTPDGHPWLKPLRRHPELERAPGRGDDAPTPT